MSKKLNINFVFFTIICLLGSIYSGNLIANKQNPIIINAPNVNNNPVIEVRFSFDSNSPGIAYNQFIGLVFPSNVKSDLQFDDGSSNKYSCALTDGTTTYQMTAEKPLVSSEGNIAYCKLTDKTNNSIKKGNFKLSVTLIGIKITSNYVRSMKMFTSTSNKISKMIIDQLSFLGNIALYNDPLVFINKSIDIVSSEMLLGSSAVTSIYPYQSFDISLNIKSNIFISQKDLLISFKFDKNVVSAATSVISNSLNLGSENDPLSNALKGNLSLSTSTSGDCIFLNGIAEDLIPNRQFQIILKSWGALDSKTNTLSPLEMKVYYKNTYSLISYVNANTNFFKISYANITLKAEHPDGWDIFRSGVFPMKYTFSSPVDLPKGGFVLIQQTNTVDLNNRWNFVAATCDFSDNESNMNQSFGGRPICNSIRTDFEFAGTNSTGYAGSGIFFYLKSIQANKNYYVTVFGSADACGPSTTLTDFGSATSGTKGTTAKFNFRATVYKSIDPSKSNEERFTNIPIIGQSISQEMDNTCWNAMTVLNTNLSTPATSNNAPAVLPFLFGLLRNNILVTPTNGNDCDPLNSNSAAAYCKLTNDVNLYREFYNVKLLNTSSRYTASSYLTDLTKGSANGSTENYIYGSNVVSTNSYLAFTIDIQVYDKTKFFEVVPTPIAGDKNGGGDKLAYRLLPGRLEMKVQKNWFQQGDAASSTSPGCFLGFGTNINMGDNSNVIMRDVTDNSLANCLNDTNLGSWYSTYTNTAAAPNDCSTATPNLDTTNSKLPISGSTNTYPSYKILSTWNSTAAGAKATDNSWPILPSWSKNTKSNVNWPLTATALNYDIDTADNKIVFGIFTTCLKWNPPSVIKSLYTSIDIQLNHLYATDATTIATAIPHRAMRIIKLFPEGGVFQDVTGNAKKVIATGSSDQTNAATRAYKLHHSYGGNSTKTGVCLIEINSAGLVATTDSSSPVLAIWIGFGTILETDYNDLSATYPVAPLANSKYGTYGLQSGLFFNAKENFMVQKDFGETTVYVKQVANKADINQNTLRLQLMELALDGYQADIDFSAGAGAGKYRAGTNASVISKFPSFRSSYLFLMGSIVFITDISSNAITTNTNADNLLIPIYCPLNDQTNKTHVQRSGIPTLYMAFMKMGAYNDITSVNRIYSVKNTADPIYSTIIVPDNQASAHYYKQSFATNPVIFTSDTNFYQYLFTLRWAPYTSTITNNDNILYFYYSNVASAGTTDANANCTGHTLLINSTIVTLDSTITNIKKSGFASVTDPAVYQGTKKFYYLGNEFNQAIMMGLGLSTNVTATKNATGALAQQVLTAETSTYYLTGIKRPSVDKFYVNNSFNPQFFAIGYFCNSAQKESYNLFSNYIIYPTSLTKSFILDFNPPVTSAKTWTVTVAADKSETIIKNDVAGNVKITMALPAKIPGGINLSLYAGNNSFNANTICGIVNTDSTPVNECTLSGNLFSCPTSRNDINFVICCYNISISSDTFSISTLYADVPKAPNTDQIVRFNTAKIYDAASQISSTPISWTTGQSSGEDVIGTKSAQISNVEYYQVVQDSGIGKAVFTVSLPREPARNMALTLIGDFSGMLIPNILPRCQATFGTTLGANWDSSADVLLDTCDVSNFSGSTSPIVITTKNLVYKCGLTFASKEVKVSLWPIVQVNWKINPFSSNNYKVTMTLNTNSKDPMSSSSNTFNISNSLTYAEKPGFTGQWDTLCSVSNVTPLIPGEYSDYTFEIDLDTNKAALNNLKPNEVSIFFPYVHYGASNDNILCFYNNATMNCSFTDEGILNIRFTTDLPVGSGKRIPIIITGIYNPSFTGDILFPCTINTTNFSTGLRRNLITGSGKLTGGIPIKNNASQGNLRFINVLNATDLNPRNISTHTFRVTFDQAIGMSTSPITISNTPQIIITFPDDYNLNWYTTTKATASIDEFTNDTSNKVTMTKTITPLTTVQSGNKVTITLKETSYTFNSNWRYWEIKVNSITAPTDTTNTNTSINGTTGPYNIILTNSIYSSIYRTFSNLNNAAYNQMNKETDNFLKYNRGIEFEFDQTKWVVDINTSGVFNKLTIKAGRFTQSTFTVKANSSNFIQPRYSIVSLSNNQLFKLSDNQYPIVTAKNEPISFYIGAPCGTAPGKYIIYFTMTGTQYDTYFAPLAPVQITLDTSIKGNADFTIPSSIPAGASTFIYYNFSEPNFDRLTVSWSSSEIVKNDLTAKISDVIIEKPDIKAGDSYIKGKNYSTFIITNLQATNSQVFVPKTLNNCFKWTAQSLTIKISGTQAIIPNQYNFTSSFKYFNSATDETLPKNSIKFEFTPPYSPIYLYCALVCYNRKFPIDDVIKRHDNVSDNLSSYYISMFDTTFKTNIIFNNLVRGQRYKLRCIISSTEGVYEQRTSAAVSIESLASKNGSISQFIPTGITKTQCVQYYFTSDPGQATKIAMVNYCQKLFSGLGFSSSGCVICTDSELTYTSPGLNLPSNLTCTASSTKSKLRFLQTTSDTTNNSTILTPTSASSTVNPSLVNQSNPITFSICPVQHPICKSDVSGNKLYTDLFNQLITDTKTTSLFKKNLGIVNVPVNNTLTVTDLKSPDISKNFVVEVTSINSNGLIVFNAKFTSALRCSWQIADSSNAPASGSAVAECTDTQWCGKNFQVGTLVSNTATDINNLKSFSSGKTYALYFGCFNDVPYSTSVSNIYSIPLSIPNNNNPQPIDNNTTNTNTTGTSAGFIEFSSAILLILALLI